YQELYLHLEDAVDYPSLPGVARADAYSWSEFTRLVEAASRVGLRVVPIVNLLGHTQYLIKTPEWRDLNELRGSDGSPLDRGQICPLHPRTLEVASRLLDDVAPLCTAGKVHVGLDESFHLGRHPLSRAEIAEVGLATHFARYVQRLHGLAATRRLRLGIWADMLIFLRDAIPQLPPDLIAYDWYYHAFRRLPRVELFNFAEYDLATPLRAHGIEYWGCPMNGAFRFEPLPVFGERLANATSWWRHGQRVGAAGFLVTSWEPYRLALPLTTVVDAAIASLWLEPPVDDHGAMLTRGFERVFGRDRARAAARAALATDAYSFAGYARWEINQRWDITPANATLAPYERERRLHARLSLRPDLPLPLSASLAFRRYLAERDVFVRRAAKQVLNLRRALATRARRNEKSSPLHRAVADMQAEARAFAGALRAGRRAARAMWGLTRDRSAVGQNETILAADAERLAQWRAWLRDLNRDPTTLDRPSPIVGAWQLQFVVVNFAPALSRVVVEQGQADGTWQELQGRHTIEFRTVAARPRANVRRAFVVSVDRPQKPLRLALRGVGQVAITQVELTDGVSFRRPRN
ncbi:MAG TPA: family 20 glycosylhydrolase, partial [Candidatus Synoicihabitans sp.]|nr:family 20 glycosylhydrolase [Candidatus Synoicihabitans sp.]